LHTPEPLVASMSMSINEISDHEHSMTLPITKGVWNKLGQRNRGARLGGAKMKVLGDDRAHLSVTVGLKMRTLFFIERH
jgi:hypothetical protein